MYILKNLNRFTEQPKVVQERIFRKFFDIAEVAQLNKQDMETYNKSLKEKWDWYSGMKTQWEKGKAEGIAEGKTEGKAEYVKTTALNMKNKGVDLQTISDYTGLSEEEIKQL